MMILSFTWYKLLLIDKKIIQWRYILHMANIEKIQNQINVLFDKKIHSTKQMMKKSISLLKKIILIKGYQVPFFGTFGPLVFKQVGLESWKKSKP